MLFIIFEIVVYNFVIIIAMKNVHDGIKTKLKDRKRK